MPQRPESRFGHRDEGAVETAASPVRSRPLLPDQPNRTESRLGDRDDEVPAQPDLPSRPESRWGFRENDPSDKSPIPRERLNGGQQAGGAPQGLVAVGDLSEDAFGASLRSKPNVGSDAAMGSS